jgi:ankyrin repeat protein
VASGQSAPPGRGRDRSPIKLTPRQGEVVTDEHELFERAADAVAFGRLADLRELLDRRPALVRDRSARPHRATLLHYCGANGTEDPRQRTPPNAPAVAELLLSRGADPDAGARFYGTADTTLVLVLTSVFPRDAGLDGELVRVLAAGGARIDAGPGDRPIVTAISHGRPRSAAALVAAGVAVDDLFVAAGVGRTDVLAALLTAGARPDTRFAHGLTALHAAAATGHRAAAELLLEHGAPLDVLEERWAASPAGIAEYNGHAGLAALLRRPR